MENSVLLVCIYLPKIPQFFPKEEKKINLVITSIHYISFSLSLSYSFSHSLVSSITCSLLFVPHYNVTFYWFIFKKILLQEKEIEFQFLIKLIFEKILQMIFKTSLVLICISVFFYLFFFFFCYFLCFDDLQNIWSMTLYRSKYI